jgi:hypothetical protein
VEGKLTVVGVNFSGQIIETEEFVPLSLLQWLIPVCLKGGRIEGNKFPDRPDVTSEFLHAETTKKWV